MKVLHLDESMFILKYTYLSSYFMQLIAHRGASKHAPENTLEAFTLAYQKGIHIIECDLAISQDSVVYIIHDDTFNRTTNADGSILNANWAMISKLDAGSWFSTKYQHAKIPSLDDLLLWHQKHPVTINLEIKTISKEKIPLFLDVLFQSMEKVKNIDNFIFSSFQFELIESLKKEKKDWRIAALTLCCQDASIQKAESMGCEWYSTSFQSCSLSWVEKIHSRGMKVGVFTVNEADKLQKLKTWGVDFVFTDDVMIDII